MTATQQPDVNTPEGFVLCPECGVNVAAPVQASLVDDPLYKKAKRIHLGFHRWHVFMKIASFVFLGSAVWINDFCDGVMRLLCTKTSEVVDSATQSFAWKWTMGWFLAPVPKVTQEVSQLYGWYSFATTIVLVVAVVWLSRWFYWTTILDDFQSNKPKDQRGGAAVGTALLGMLFWVVEYAVLGLTAGYLCGQDWPTPIRILPDWTGWVAFAFAIGTIVSLALTNAPEGQTADSGK
jgi:hypothetical protein